MTKQTDGELQTQIKKIEANEAVYVVYSRHYAQSKGLTFQTEKEITWQSNIVLLSRILKAGPEDWLADPKYRNLTGTDHSADYFKALGHDKCNDQWRATIQAEVEYPDSSRVTK